MKQICGVFALISLCICVATVVGEESFEPAVPPAFERGSSELDGNSSEDEGVDPFDPDYNAPRIVEVHVETIELDHTALSSIMRGMSRKTSDASPLRERLQRLIDENRATVFETQLLTGLSGQKTTGKSVQLFAAPTEYEITMDPVSKKPFAEIAPLPTDFEEREIGSILDVEPTIAENEKIIDLRIVNELTWPAGEIIWQEHKSQAGVVNKMQMPIFYQVEVNTSLTCVDGQPGLLAVVSPKDEKGSVMRERKLVMLVTCNILTVK